MASPIAYLQVTTLTQRSNTTEDIVKAGCFQDPFSIIACIRYALMSGVILITGLFCVQRIYKLHAVRHQAYHHYLVFYSSVISCVLCTVHWLLGDYAQLDFVAQWFKQLSYLVVTHFFWTRAYRAIRREKLSVFCLLPGLVIGLIYCTVTLGLGIAYVNDYTDACLAFVWVMMSSAELFIAQMFLLSGFFISKRLDRISTVQSVRTSQKRKLWGLVAVFEITAIVAFTYDLTMIAVGSQYQNCGRIFNFNQLVYSSVFTVFMVVKFALPIWAMLLALEPVGTTNMAEEDDSGSIQSSDQVPIVSGRHTRYIPALASRIFRTNTSTTPTHPATTDNSQSPTS
ncbi:hypothetical protein EB796_008653 [Bugula neritina]|uniref:Uncharacterized protein n=1 Tax=Bugula neritina TaxID=10212 RepID=A0A7J7K368_BUGNE|nr:hypothetical protein EB796_008653 [Bugula neritina]